MKRIRKIVFAIVLCITIITVVRATNAEATNVHITITFAAGDVACGIYFFCVYSSSLAGDGELNHADAAAVFNHSPEGLQVRPPVLHFGENHDKGYTPYAEILRIRC